MSLLDLIDARERRLRIPQGWEPVSLPLWFIRAMQEDR